MKPLERIGADVKAAREGRRLSRAALAGRCDLSEDQVAAIERGEIEPTATALIKIEDALAMPRGSSCRGVSWDQRNLHFAVEPRGAFEG